MPSQTTQAKPRRRLLTFGLIALMLWIVGIILFLLTNQTAVPFLAQLFEGIAIIIASGGNNELLARSRPPIGVLDLVGFAASVISIVGAIPPTTRFFLHAARLIRRPRKAPKTT